MKFINKQKAVSLMNTLGSEKRPFIFIIDYLQREIYIETIDKIDSDILMYDFNGIANLKEHHAVNKEAEIISTPIEKEKYAEGYNNIIREINKGNSYLINYTCCTPIKMNLSLEDIFHRARAPYRLWMKNRFVVFSPEIFVKIKEDSILSYPMKGTIDASIPDAESKIMEDEKEKAEHATIVDLIRNDLSQVANEVEVVRFRYIDKIETNRGWLLQVSSEIKGKLNSSWRNNIGDIIFSLLPAGSITGAPKKKTMEIISASECYERGFYTGIMGIFDGSSLDSAVMIRFIEQSGDEFYFKSGGGITSRSELDKEYNEMIQKVYVPFNISRNDKN